MKFFNLGKRSRKQKVIVSLGALVVGVAIGTGIYGMPTEEDLIVESNAMEPSTKLVEEIKKTQEVEKEVVQEEKHMISKDQKSATEKEEKVDDESGKKKEEKSGVGEKEVVEKKELPSTEKKEEPKVETSTKTSTATESVTFETVRQNDNTLEKGKEVVAQEGKNGVKTITYKETYVNGKLASKDVVSTKVTQQPTNKVVKVGTKEKTANASGLLSASGFSKSGNNYTYSTGLSGTFLTVTVSGDRVTKVSFDGGSYYTWKYMTKEALVNNLGEEAGETRYNELQQDMKTIESAIRSAANAVYGKGTAKANAVYSEILSGGDTQTVYTKSF